MNLDEKGLLSQKRLLLSEQRDFYLTLCLCGHLTRSSNSVYIDSLSAKRGCMLLTLYGGGKGGKAEWQQVGSQGDV